MPRPSRRGLFRRWLCRRPRRAPPLRHAKPRLAMLTLDQLSPHVIRYAQQLSTAKIRTDQLHGHRRTPANIIGKFPLPLEPPRNTFEKLLKTADPPELPCADRYPAYIAPSGWSWLPTVPSPDNQIATNTRTPPAAPKRKRACPPARSAAR